MYISICLSIYLYLSIYVYLSIHLSIYLSIFIYVYIHIYLYIYTHTHTHICIYIYIHISAYTYIYIYLSIIIYIYIYIYIYYKTSMTTYSCSSGFGHRVPGSGIQVQGLASRGSFNPTSISLGCRVKSTYPHADWSQNHQTFQILGSGYHQIQARSGFRISSSGFLFSSFRLSVSNFQVSRPRSSEYGTCKTVKARFWTWLSGKVVKQF